MKIFCGRNVLLVLVKHVDRLSKISRALNSATMSPFNCCISYYGLRGSLVRNQKWDTLYVDKYVKYLRITRIPFIPYVNVYSTPRHITLWKAYMHILLRDALGIGCPILLGAICTYSICVCSNEIYLFIYIFGIWYLYTLAS